MSSKAPTEIVGPPTSAGFGEPPAPPAHKPPPTAGGKDKDTDAAERAALKET